MSKRKSKADAEFRAAFVLDWGSYACQSVVLINTPKAEALAYMRRAKLKKAFIAAFEAEDIPLSSTGAGYWWYCPEPTGSVISVSSEFNQWPFWEALVHECHHAVHRWLGKDRGMANETEALAYQQEYLWKTIRQKCFSIQRQRSRRKSK